VSRQDLYLNRDIAKSGVLLPTILEGTPLESSAEFFGLDYGHEEVVGVSFYGVVLEAMYKFPPFEVTYSNQGEVLRLWSKLRMMG
jgi:hypothetical protein